MNKKKVQNPDKVLKKVYKVYDELYDKICNFVKEHQGEKGYIDTQKEGCDGIYVALYEGDELVEKRVHAIKCVDKDLLILCDDDVHTRYRVVYTDEDIKKEDENESDTKWWYAGYGGESLWLDTLASIAEVIAEYV